MKDKKKFDPNSAAAKDSGIFGLPFSVKDSKLALLQVPWEATTSYGGGTAEGPKAILVASRQVDLYDIELGTFYKVGIAMADESAEIRQWNATAKKAAKAKSKKSIKAVNNLSQKVNEFVYNQTKSLLKENKIVGLVGGDHSSPLGAIKAVLEVFPKAGILHFDAHADLRKAYEGFEHSHASIMYNVLNQTGLEKLVQVGIRDFSEDEFALIKKSKPRIKTFFDEKLSEAKFEGKIWADICLPIVEALPKEVYISFDIDGLDPVLCPHTGTPVPGGLKFQEALYLIKLVATTGRKIIGFDLNEVTPGPEGDEWDANVGARLLYKLCGWTLQSQRRK